MRKITTPIATACLLLSLAACGDGADREDPSGTDAKADKSGTSDAESKSKSEAETDNPFAGMASNPFAALMTKKLGEPGPYDAPKQSPDYADDAPHLRVLKLGGSVGEVEVFDPMAFGGGGASLQTRALLTKLDALAAEDELDALILRIGDLSLDIARAEELRGALLAFKGEGARKLHCHAENLGNASYYLASACDELVVVPVGTVMVPGPAATPVHLKGLLDKLGIGVDVLHVGAFKGAAEPLTRDAPSPEMIETLEAVVEQAYQTMVHGIASGRAKPEDEVRAWIDMGLYTAEDAAVAGMIDGVEAWEPFLDRVRGERGWKQVELKDKPWSDPLALQRFLGLSKPKRPSEPHVALIYAVGNIIDGKGGGALGATSEIAAGQLVPVLDRIAADDKVTAVVLRIDSGGGSARASEQIWHAVERLKANKPVVVSMAGVAASGGYYIAAGAQQIFAQTDTLTGSIGVVGGKPVVGPALEELGIKTYAVTRGANAMMWSPMQAWTETERERVYATMEQTYEVFLSRVAAGRGLDRDAVHEVAQGRVWTGAAAKDRGLVDEIGGLEAALAAAHELGKVDAEVGLEVYPGEPTIKDLLGSFEQLVGVQTLPAGVDAMLAPLAASLGPHGAPWLASTRAALTTLTSLQGSSVWVVEWIQPPR